MDKRKIIHAYRRGLLTAQECAQLLGIDAVHMIGLMEQEPSPSSMRIKTTTVHS
jgi:hypothetical protein